MVVGYGCLVQAFIVLPGALIYMITRDPEEIESYEDRFGVLFEGIKTKSKWDLAYYLLYIIRRLTFCLIAISFKGNTVYQFQALYILNLFMGIYIGYNASKKSPSLNRVDLFNELFIQILTIHVVLFTDFVSDPEL